MLCNLLSTLIVLLTNHVHQSQWSEAGLLLNSGHLGGEGSGCVEKCALLCAKNGRQKLLVLSHNGSDYKK